MFKKNKIRDNSKKLRQIISKKSSKNFISEKIFNKLFKLILDKTPKLENIAIYYPINNEISPLIVVDFISKFGFNLGLPK